MKLIVSLFEKPALGVQPSRISFGLQLKYLTIEEVRETAFSQADGRTHSIVIKGSGLYERWVREGAAWGQLFAVTPRLQVLDTSESTPWGIGITSDVNLCPNYQLQPPLLTDVSPRWPTAPRPSAAMPAALPHCADHVSEWPFESAQVPQAF